MESSLNNQ